MHEDKIRKKPLEGTVGENNAGNKNLREFLKLLKEERRGCV